MCKGIRSITKQHADSMVALHVPVRHFAQWDAGMIASTMHHIPSPITISSVAQPSYAPTFKHNPLRACDTFHMWRNRESKCPTHNAVALGAYNKAGKWRYLWGSCQNLPPAVFNKGTGEVLERLQPVPLEQADELDLKHTSFYHSDADKASQVPEWVKIGVGKECKKRQKAWRKEQLSQGVLGRMLAILGRVAFHQVPPPPPSPIE